MSNHGHDKPNTRSSSLQKHDILQVLNMNERSINPQRDDKFKAPIKFRSETPMKIGVVIPLGGTDHGKALPYSAIRDRAQQAEEIGLDSIWLYDHLIHRFPGHPTVGFWENWTMLSALAEASKKIKLGTWVLGPFRHPAMTAKQADTLEEVSNQRLILGLGSGWHKDEFEAFGVPYENRVSRFEEALQIITTLLHNGSIDFNGKYYQAKNCELKPRGSKEGPPIMIGAMRPRMMRLAARYADMWNTDWLGDKEHLSQQKIALNIACQKEGRDPSTLEITGGITIAYPKLGDLPAWMKSPNDYISGSPNEVAESLHMYENEGVSHVQCNVYPHTEEAYRQLGQAVEVFRAEQR